VGMLKERDETESINTDREKEREKGERETGK
jgi:hypothetical protein